MTEQEIRRIEVPAFRVIIRDTLKGSAGEEIRVTINRLYYRERISSLQEAEKIAQELEKKDNWGYLPDRYTDRNITERRFNFPVAVTARRCKTEPHTFPGLSISIPKPGELLYIPGSAEFEYPAFAFMPTAQVGIKGGLAKIESVKEIYLDEQGRRMHRDYHSQKGKFGWWDIRFADLGFCFSHDLEDLLIIQQRLKEKYEHHSAEPIYDTFIMGMEKFMESF